MESVCGFRPGHDYACHVRQDNRHHVSGHAPAIRRSIWSDLLCCLGPAAGHMYDLERLCLCFYGEVLRAGVRLELPLCPGQAVVSQPHYALVGRAPVPRHRIGVTISASGNFWLRAQGRILWLLGHRSIYH